MIGLCLTVTIAMIAMTDRVDGWLAVPWRRSGPRFDVRDLPDFLDVVSLALSCGTSVPEALALGARHGPASISGRLAGVVGAIDRHAAFGPALDSARLESDDPLAVILDVLQQGHVEGTALTARLEALSVDYRRIALSRDNAEARRLSVRILFPMVLCMVPAFALLTIVPVLGATLNAS